MSLTVDPDAPTGLPHGRLSAKLATNKSLNKLIKKRQMLTNSLRREYGTLGRARADDPNLQEKKEIDTAISRLKANTRNKEGRKYCRKYWRNADTALFEAQHAGSPTVAADDNPRPARTPHYDIEERALLARLTCAPASHFSDLEKHKISVHAIEARVALSLRQETRHRRNARRSIPSASDATTESCAPSRSLSPKSEYDFPLICKPKQCIFCLGNERLSTDGRTFEYARTSKMMDEVERHLTAFAPGQGVPCPHPTCKTAGVFCTNVAAFKNHTAKVHEIFLRS